MRHLVAGTTPNPPDMDYPMIEEGVVASSAENASWSPLDYTPTQRATYGDATLNSDRGGLG